MAEYLVSAQALRDLDEWYAERSPDGRPSSWGPLVQALRALRRRIESGTPVQIADGPVLRTWAEFYAWAHGRYHCLEDGYDAWIGDDR